MSSLCLKLCVQPEENDSLEKINKFISFVKAGDYLAIEELDTEEVLYERDDDDDPVFTNIESGVNDGVVYMELDTPCSFEVEVLVELMQSFGAKNVEISVFNSQVGEYFFYKNNEYLNSYNDAEWAWLQNPEL